jgi:alpha-tubulin suppressor-like RCC1 family protein
MADRDIGVAQPRALVLCAAALLAGCNSIVGLSDLEKVDGGVSTGTGPHDGGPGSKVPAEVTVGRYGSCARMDDDTVRCWGSNVGQEGLWSSARPVRVAGLEAVSWLSVGTHHACVIADGVVYCWGENTHGQLGDGTRETRATPVKVNGLDGVKIGRVAAAGSHSCAQTDDEPIKLYCWGSNYFGQLGTGDYDDRPQATLLPPLEGAGGTGGSGGSGGDGGAGGVAAQRTDGLTIIQHSAGSDNTCAAVPATGIVCWGRNDRGQLGVDPELQDRSAEPHIIPGVETFERAYIGGGHICARSEDKKQVKCWGANEHGQLGNGKTVDSPLAGEVALDGTIDLVNGGARHTCAFIVEPAEKLYCWGANDYGQIGIPLDENPTPVEVTGFEYEQFSTRTSEHTCIVRADGSAWCIGLNDAGQLGNGQIGGSSRDLVQVQF